MRILHVVPSYIPAYRYGGPVKSIHEMARKLVELGVDVTVFTTNADGPEDLAVETGKETLVEGVKVIYFPVEKPRSYFRSTRLAQAVRDWVKEFDLVHINWLYVYPTMVAARECIRQKVPYIIAPRGMLDPNAIALKGTLKKKLYLNLIEKKHLYGAAAVHFTADGEREQASSAGWKFNSIVVPNGLAISAYNPLPDGEKFRTKFPELVDKKLVLFLGRLNYIKGLDLLAKAWPMVVEAVPDAHLVLAGPDDDGYADKVRAWLVEGGIESSATFTGMLLGEDKLAAFAAAEVFVASSYLESFGMAIVEAMACGKPVVITDRVNICRDVENAGAGFVTSCEPAKIAEALIAVLQNPAHGKEMGMKGRRLVEEKFTQESAAKQMLAAYEMILSGRTQDKKISHGGLHG